MVSARASHEVEVLMSKSLRVLVVILVALLVAAAAIRLAWAGDPGLAAPPAMPSARLTALSDEELVSQLNLDWTWRRSPPAGGPAQTIPEPARHLLAIVGNEAGIRSHGLISVAVASLINPQGDDLAAIAAAYETIGGAAAGRLLRQAAAIAAQDGALISQWRTHLAQQTSRPARDPFAELDRQVKAELATPALRQKLAIYLRRHLDQLAGGG